MNTFNKPISEIRELIVANARKFVGTRFVHRGRTINGVDCVGLIILAYRRSGVVLPDHNTIYHPGWYWNKKEADLLTSNAMRYFVFTENPLPGDAIVFRCVKGLNKITHSGILIDNNGAFIHARSGRFVESQTLGFRYWTMENRFAGYMVYKGFNEEM
jgi:cell wall-associated NlpC family hydrolase